MFGPKRIRCPAGSWTTLISNAFVQIPCDFYLRFEGAGVDGELEEKKSKWIVPGSPVTTRLTPQVTLHRGWFNTFYRVRVRPLRECIAVVA